MSLDEVLGMNVAEVIEHHGTTEGFRDRVFLTFKDDDGVLQQVTFEDYFQRSVEYGTLFSEMKDEQAVLDGQRFHVGTLLVFNIQF